MDFFNHFVVGHTRLLRQRHTPHTLVFLADLFIRHFFIAWHSVRHTPEVTCSLHVIMAAQWVRTCSRFSVVSCHKQQVRDRRARVASSNVLCHAHRPQCAHTVSLPDHLCHLDKGFSINPGFLLSIFKCVRREAFYIFISSVHSFSQKSFIGLAVFY